jgi:hypothetical protein
MATYYQALCTITRFPEYHCVLKTVGSLALPYALAALICGLRVCVIVDGQVIHGNSSAGQWKVLLERVVSRGHHPLTNIKLGRKLEDIQDLLVVDEVGSPRANRIPIKGLGKASTIGQGLNKSEAEELAVCAACIATRALMDMKREYKPYSKLSYDSTLYGGSSDDLEEVRIGHDFTSTQNPVQAHVSIPALALWWDCSEVQAKTLYDHALEHPMFLGDQKGWDEIGFGKQVIGKIAKFEASGNQAQVYNTTLGPCSRGDYTKLLRHLTSQIVLISFLRFNDISGSQIRVRSSCKPSMSPIGKIIKGTFTTSTIGQADVLASWYYWLQGSMPKDLARIEALSSDGFIIYRSLLLDLSLDPQACEMVIVQPGHILFDKSRFDTILGREEDCNVIGHPQYRKLRAEPFTLSSTDKTGRVDLFWEVGIRTESWKSAYISKLEDR